MRNVGTHLRLVATLLLVASCGGYVGTGNDDVDDAIASEAERRFGILEIAANNLSVADVPLGSYRGFYYDDSVAGVSRRAAERSDAKIDFDWGTTAPMSGVPANEFSVYWIGRHTFAAGKYRFTATVDDGLRVYVDGLPIIDAFKDQAPATYTADVDVPAGDHLVQVFYYEAIGGAVAKLSFAPVGAPPPPATTSRVVAPRVASTMTVDGVLNEAGWSLSATAAKSVFGTANNNVTFGTMWNASYLYVGVKVLDAGLRNDSVDVWDDDAVEVYIDADHNRGATYDGFDRQFSKGWSDATLAEIGARTTGVLHGWAAVPGGYVIELGIPWSNLGITPSADSTVLGFDIGNNDDDDGATRDGQLTWLGTVNNYASTADFGELALSSQTVGSGGSNPPPPPPPSGGSADAVWTTLNVMSVVNPMSYGAAGNGTTDDLGALNAAVGALPATGGVVYLPPSKTFRKNDLFVITKPHVKLWSPNRQATIFGSVAGARRRQSTLCRAAGCGFFGLKLTSDAAARFDALEDNQVSVDHATDAEIIGNEINNSAATGIFLYGSQRTYIEGNYVHHTYADHIHHTEGARQSWVWDNWIKNNAPSDGDDGIACVTYCPTCTKCGDMEWFKNIHLGSGHGRGYAVIGGDHIQIHDNWGIATSAAGIIVASEPSYSSASSNDIDIRDNWLYRTVQQTSLGHSGILLSGQNGAAPAIARVTLDSNIVVETMTGQAFRSEGAVTGTTNTAMSTLASDLPGPVPTLANVKVKDTSVMRTRDNSFVAASFRPGLYRIHVRPAPSGGGFQQRFEYVVKGAPADVQSWTSARVTAGDYLSETRQVSGVSYAVLLARAPLSIPGTLTGVSFTDLRAGDRSGALTWLWNRVDGTTY